MSDEQFEVPDDLSGLLDEAEGPPTLAVLLTQVASAAPLAAVCALSAVPADALDTPVGALAVLRDPNAGPAAAAAVSRLLAGTQVVLLERREGRLAATGYADGADEGELAAGLVLSEGPPVLEDLLLGGAGPEVLAGAVDSTGISRWKAMRMLATGRRKS